MQNNSHSFSERVLRDMHSAVLVLDKKGRIVYTNEPAARMFEVTGGYLEEHERFPLLAENTYNDSFNEVIFNALYNKEETTVKKVPYMAPSGKKYIFLMSGSYLNETESDDAQLVITLSDETVAEEMTRKFNDSSRTFTTFLFGFCIWSIVCALWEFTGRAISQDYLTHGQEVLGIIMLIYILRHTSLSWRDIGITTHEPGATVRTACIVAGCAVLFLCGFKAVFRMIDPDCFGPDSPFIDFSRFGVRQILYIFTAGIQEFLMRSVVQGNLKRITVGTNTSVLAILLSSLLFASLHCFLGLMFMLGAAILAGLEGILYDKQNNIFGVWIVHWVFGVSGTLLCLIDH
ncbi:MAG: CPBP family glutamic-type intramembrane protease [Eubacteriales bacterium]|nr:CPBP family glutamic-type intramembrane protease [Eubacteriales bacterium]